MLASSAFVLAALTMTGVYMKGQNVESRDDGYTLDFTALPNNADDKLQEITENNDEHLLKEDENIPGLTANNTAGNEIAGAPVTEDDLDYMPQEVGSGNVEIPGLTDQETLLEAAQKEQQNSDADRQKEETGGKQTAGGDVVVVEYQRFIVDVAQVLYVLMRDRQLVGKIVEHLLRYFLVIDDDRIVEVTTFDQVILQQHLYFADKHECAGSSQFCREFTQVVQRGELVGKHRRIEGNQNIDAKLVVRQDNEG